MSSSIRNYSRFGDADGDFFVGIENLTGTPYIDLLYGDDNANILRGLGSSDRLVGYGGDDYLDGGTDYFGSIIVGDRLEGWGGNDTYIVDSTYDVIVEFGGEGNDQVLTSVSLALLGADIETLATTQDAGTGAIDLTANASSNTVRGNNGPNVINGGLGRDELIGLGGQDSFLFNTALSEAFNVDVITDFNVADDTIQLDQDIFSSSLGLGNISSGEFVIGTAALDANDRIIYDSNSGGLFYDSDGVGGNAAIQFARLSTGLALTNLDFLVV